MSIQIQLARFKLNPEKLKDYSVAILKFPFEEALNDFMQAVRDIRANGKELDWEELPPFSSLNDVLWHQRQCLSMVLKNMDGEKKTAQGENRRSVGC